jgi:hypothetical protein
MLTAKVSMNSLITWSSHLPVADKTSPAEIIGRSKSNNRRSVRFLAILHPESNNRHRNTPMAAQKFITF